MLKKTKIYYLLFFVLIALYLFYRYLSSKEGLASNIAGKTPKLGETQCTQFTNCSDCTTKRTTSGNPCYWNPNPPKNEQSCGSFAGDGWLPTCGK
jgi:hypothetical protein